MAAGKRKLFVDASPLAAERTSGVGHCVYGLVRALVEDPDFTSRYELCLVAPVRGMRFVRALGLPGVTYRPVPLPARVWNRLPGTPLMPFMDLLFGRGVYFLTNFRAWPLLGSPSIVLIHDVAFKLFPDTLTRRARAFLDHNVRRWVNRATLVATVSDSSKTEVARELNVAPERIEVVYNGVDTRIYHPRTPAEIAAVRTKYGLPEQYVLFVGNIEPRKNIGGLVSAYLDLPAELKAAYGLVIVGGSSWLSAELDQKIADAVAAGANIVRPNAYVTDADLPVVYAGARLLAHPAFHEGFGMSVIEAMASGVPTLTSRTPALVEVAGEAAYLVEPNDTAALTEGLRRVLTEETLRSQLVGAGQARAKDFSWARSATKLTALADRLYSEKLT